MKSYHRKSALFLAVCTMDLRPHQACRKGKAKLSGDHTSPTDVMADWRYFFFCTTLWAIWARTFLQIVVGTY